MLVGTEQNRVEAKEQSNRVYTVRVHYALEISQIIFIVRMYTFLGIRFMIYHTRMCR